MPPNGSSATSALTSAASASCPPGQDLTAPRYDRDKGDFLRWLDTADYFVDDSPANIEQARALGLRTLLYPQPWNTAAAGNRVPAFGRRSRGAPIAGRQRAHCNITVGRASNRTL